MAKFFLRFSLLVIITVTLSIIFLSYFGIETDKFDSIIKEKANEVNQNVKLEFNKTKIHLSLSELNLVVKLNDPKISIRNDEINLSKLNLFISIKSFFSSDFLLKKAEISFAKNHIKDLTKISNIFVAKIINKQIDKIFVKGEIEGEFIIPFDADGNIGNDYGFSGKILDASINITKELNIENLTTEITHAKDNKANLFNIRIKKGSLLDFELADSVLGLKRENDEMYVESLLKINGEFNLSKVKKISSLLNLNITNIEEIKGQGYLKTNIDFKLNKKYRIKNLIYSMEGEIPYSEIYFKKKKIIKKYLPDYKDEIIFKDLKIKFNKKKNNNMTELNGLMKINNNFDNFKIKQIYDHSKKTYDIVGNANLTNSKINISNLN